MIASGRSREIQCVEIEFEFRTAGHNWLEVQLPSCYLPTAIAIATMAAIQLCARVGSQHM